MPREGGFDTSVLSEEVKVLINRKGKLEQEIKIACDNAVKALDEDYQKKKMTLRKIINLSRQGSTRNIRLMPDITKMSTSGKPNF